ncbi:nitrogenase molybdenum-iron protein NifN [Skermanella aerolata]|uniref:Nitrogenase iron-molybdenum cofactor biosynthesis protein NifN n=1 Tax=Skermanella aerolata TaxID=393310 RepID=A0A512DWU4_9PROT|nr:nitrogenase iron-molybdenum cofactor biosynthesis protein NifN [Skermanella aerolata]KJB93725.1 nitrogenase molybdenum-cofactor biosynthesis protein NifN [Skermanella aerolata KACC 11604]GEO40932.1 nitrogenase iron-molybdenum cofactor biosynthesis protein NifN [Skermanella aerolata]
MFKAHQSNKAAAINPLKMSQPLGGALALLGIDSCLPCFHGSQGCTAFGLVLMVRHFREAIPLQTTAMDQVQTILGGYDNLEAAVLTMYERNKPEVIGVCSTGLTETKGEDMRGALTIFRKKHPEVAEKCNLVFINTPDFTGGIEDGFANTVTAVIDAMVEPASVKVSNRVNVLAGSHLTPGDVEEIRDLIEGFGLTPVILPDLSTSLGGRQPDDFTATTLGGVTAAEIKGMGAAVLTLAIGEHMRKPAEALELKTGVPFKLFDRLVGLEAVDAFITTLSGLSDRPVPARVRRQREHLVDGMLDGHFYFSRKRVAVALEPDLLYAYCGFLQEMGCEVTAAVAPTQSAILEKIRAWSLLVGDHEDFETLSRGADLVVSNSHARMSVSRSGAPLVRAGFPTFDRLGAGHRVVVGYRGTRDLLFEIGNIFLANDHEHSIQDWGLEGTTEGHHGGSHAKA